MTTWLKNLQQKHEKMSFTAIIFAVFYKLYDSKHSHTHIQTNAHTLDVLKTATDKRTCCSDRSQRDADTALPTAAHSL